MEKVGKIPMEKLHENAERIWKVLSQFPNGEATAKRLMQITFMSKTTTYNALKELHSKGYVIRESPLWKIKEKSSSRILKNLLNKSYVSERLIRKQLSKFPEIESLIGEYERKFGEIEDFREEILDEGSDVVEIGYADNLSKEDVQQINEREELRRLIAQKVEDIIYS